MAKTKLREERTDLFPSCAEKTQKRHKSGGETEFKKRHETEFKTEHVVYLGLSFKMLLDFYFC